MSQHSSCAPRRAFTLVELLVVVGIITVLIAVLLPAIRGAMRRAEAVACLSNLRQLAQAHAMYRNDHKGAAPLYRGDGAWTDALRSYYGETEAILHCPSATDDEGLTGYGSATRPWSYPRPLRGGYGYNGWVHQLDGIGYSIMMDFSGLAAWFLRPAATDAPRAPLMGDCTWSIAWPKAINPTPPDLQNGDRARQFNPPRYPNFEDVPPPGITVGPTNMMARYTLARHGRAVNLVFLDGHGEPVPLDDLKRLKWHEGFEFTDWNPPLPPR